MSDERRAKRLQRAREILIGFCRRGPFDLADLYEAAATDACAEEMDEMVERFGDAIALTGRHAEPRTTCFGTVAS